MRKRLIHVKNTKEHKETLKNPNTNAKNKNHFIGLEHETVLELYLITQNDTKDMKKHKIKKTKNTYLKTKNDTKDMKKHKEPGEACDQPRNQKNIKTKEKKIF